METTSVQIYFGQFMKILTDPMGIMVLLAMCGLAMMVVITDSGRWYALTLAIFAICCSTPSSKYMPQGPFFAPLQFMRTWSRPIAFISLLILFACLVRFDRGPRRRLMPASFWMFLFFQLAGCFRLLLIPNLALRGLSAAVFVILIALVLSGSLAPGLQSLRGSARAVWAVAGCGICFVGCSLFQYSMAPYMVQHQGRLFGMTANPNYAAYLLAFTIPSMCYLLIRRKQGIWVTFSSILFGISVPLAALCLLWTGSRGGMLTAIVSLVVFFHRRLGRFAIAAAGCVVVGLFLAPYFADAFGIVGRFFGETNTRAAVWQAMLQSIMQNPIFGHISDNANVYSGLNTGECGLLMSISLFGIVGSIPLWLTFALLGRELLQLYRIRRAIPETNDLVDLAMAFWCGLFVASLFEAFILSYFTNAMFITYTFFVIQGFIVDYGKQAEEERAGAFPVVLPEHQGYPQYAVS